MGRLDNRVAVITGSSRGLGKQIALTFASEGADIVLGDILDLEETAREIDRMGKKAVAVQTDITIKSQVQNLIAAALNRFNKLDILVNNAGVTRAGHFFKINKEDWDIVTNINLKGAFLCAQAAAVNMIERRSGKIINIASVAGNNVVIPSQTIYAATKCGLIQMTRVWACELGEYGINVNAIAPGTVLTELTYTQSTQEKVERGLRQTCEKVSLGRVGKIQDIANIALFLAADESSYINGQVITADGGWFANV